MGKLTTDHGEKKPLTFDSADKRKFRDFLEAAPDAMIVERDGRIVLANAQTEALFGYRRDELLGQPNGDRTGAAGRNARTVR